MNTTAPIMPTDTLSREARAFLIAVAQGESDPVAKGEGISPYFILVGGGSFERLPNRQGFNGFPEWPGREFPTGISHAAGRYQFQPRTWRDAVKMFPQGTPDFRNPADQDWGAWFLAQHDYRSRTKTSLLRVLQDGETAGIGNTLRPTWASLSSASFPGRYAAALNAIPGGAKR